MQSTPQILRAATLVRTCPRACSQFSRKTPCTQFIKPTKPQLRLLSQWHPRPNVRYSKPSRSAILRYQQIRHKTARATAHDLYKEYPISFSLACFCILTACLGLVYANYIYRSYIIGEFAAYPEPIAQALRRALYYSNHDLQPQNAIKYYSKALDLATEMGMDPLSNEMLGVKFQLASFLEKQIHQPKMAIEVLERVKQHCSAWVEEYGDLERQREKRTRLLGQIVRVGVKLGDLYARPDVMETEHAEESLVGAVTTLLKEQERREREGVKEGEGEWIGAEEIGGALESLATHYTLLSRPSLSTPLYLQTLPLLPPKSCHLTTTMTSLSASLFTLATSPPSPYDPPLPHSTQETHLHSAKTWAEKALANAADIAPPERTRECDEGCAVALHNLGEIAEWMGEVGEARRRYVEAGSVSRGIGFEEGVRRAEGRLRALEGK